MIAQTVELARFIACADQGRDHAPPIPASHKMSEEQIVTICPCGESHDAHEQDEKLSLIKGERMGHHCQCRGAQMNEDGCEFCGEDLEGSDTTVSCQYCDAFFCGSDCFDAHLISIPHCGGNPPHEVIQAAKDRWQGALNEW